MPELPEVETVRRVLGPQLVRAEVERVTLNRPEIIAHPSAEEFCRRMTGQRFDGMTCRGKYLALALADGGRLRLHLRMTGFLLLTPADYPQEAHTHLIFHLRNGQELCFSDTRRFGRFWLLGAGEADTYSGIEKLGAEPFDADFGADYLSAKLGKRRKSIKECLLEQSVVAGIGNIYSDEILFAAKLNPARPANSLTRGEWERLAALIPERLTFFIVKNEISAEDYLLTKGKSYRNTPFLQVYGHEGEPCPVCGAPLSRTVLGGRSSVFCSCCQPSV